MHGAPATAGLKAGCGGGFLHQLQGHTACSSGSSQWMSAICHKIAVSLERWIWPLGLLFASWGESMSQDRLCCCFTKLWDDSLEGDF